VPTLQSLQRLDHDSFEVIVVDQSTDRRTERAFSEVVGDDPRFFYVSSATMGRSAACNLAAARARGSTLAFTDDDCIPPSDWLTEMEAALARHPDVAMVCGGITPGLDGDPLYLTPQFMPVSERLYRSPWALFRTFGVGGGNTVFRAEALRSAGSFDEVLGVGAPLKAGEDRDILFRILRRGHAVLVVTTPVVEHREAKEMATEGRRLLWDYAYAEGALCMKHLRLGDPAAILPVLLLGPYLRLRWSNIIRLRRPTGMYTLAAFMSGAVAGLHYRVNRGPRTFTTETARELPERHQAAASGPGGRL
jgi:GT2 family glycosyltransferase